MIFYCNLNILNAYSNYFRIPLPQKRYKIIHELLTDKYLDTEAMSALWVGLLLSLPCDAKADNFRLQLEYDVDRQLCACRIVSIDNDLSLKMPFSMNEEKRLCLEIKIR